MQSGGARGLELRTAAIESDFFWGDNPRMGGGHVPSVPPGIYAHGGMVPVAAADLLKRGSSFSA